GVYKIKLEKGPYVDVYCKEGFTLIQKRSSKELDFNKTWEEYKAGFGSVNGDYWMGLEMIHIMTNKSNYALHVDLGAADNVSFVADYAKFSVHSEADNYTLHVSGFTGTAGNALQYTGGGGKLMHNGMPFSTPGRDNEQSDTNCAQKYGSGWWFNSCFEANLNGKYIEQTSSEP
ncbi:hypothetical protein CAPTEDRAFT_37893, partial [Capitella teleta]